jgi:AcrR family transcriptional regulator
MDRKTFQLSNRREQIIEAAAELFYQKGYSGVSMQDIAEKVGLTKGGLYNHIENKEELLYQILTRGIRVLVPRLEEIILQPDSPQEKLKKAVKEDVLVLIYYKTFVYLFQQEHSALSEERYKSFVEYRDRVEQIFRQIIEEGIASNCFKNIDIKFITFAILGMCNWIVQWYRTEGTASPQEIAEFFSNVAISMVIK